MWAGQFLKLQNYSLSSLLSSDYYFWCWAGAMFKLESEYFEFPSRWVFHSQMHGMRVMSTACE